jgi:hypothetical protein
VAERKYRDFKNTNAYTYMKLSQHLLILPLQLMGGPTGIDRNKFSSEFRGLPARFMPNCAIFLQKYQTHLS